MSHSQKSKFLGNTETKKQRWKSDSLSLSSSESVSTMWDLFAIIKVYLDVVTILCYKSLRYAGNAIIKG